MKRQTAPHNLHMGCGESLVARVPLSSRQTEKTPTASAGKTAKLKAGEGSR